MQKTKLIEDNYQALWFEQVITFLTKISLSDEDVERIIVDVIGEYVVHQITLSQLLEITKALENCKANLTPNLKYIIQDLSAIHQYKFDNQFINNILVDVLRKVSKT